MDEKLTVGRVTFGPAVLSRVQVPHNSKFLEAKFGELQAKSEFLSARQCPDHAGKWERGRCLQCEIERLTTECSDALKMARELDCMLINGAKSTRAYDKMQGLAEGIVRRLERVSGREGS